MVAVHVADEDDVYPAQARIVFNSVDAEAWAKRGEKVILTRIETSPEDIAGTALTRTDRGRLRIVGGLMLAYAGGGAGLFSTLIGGWVNGETGSKPVTRAGMPWSSRRRSTANSVSSAVTKAASSIER